MKKAKDGKIHVSTKNYNEAWGIIVPGKTGIVFHHQTDGCMCRHPGIEGVFVPFHGPVLESDPMDSIGEHNYLNYHGPTDPVWNKIAKSLGIVINCMDKAPAQFSEYCHGGGEVSMEAWWWVELKAVPKEEYSRASNIIPFLGKTVVLVYPNSD